MHIIKKGTIDSFIDQYPDSESSLIRWYLTTKAREWQSLKDIKETFGDVDYVGDDLYVFNIKGNKYRLITRIFFKAQLVYIRFIGTHAAYDKVDLDNL